MRLAFKLATAEVTSSSRCSCSWYTSVPISVVLRRPPEVTSAHTCWCMLHSFTLIYKWSHPFILFFWCMHVRSPIGPGPKALSPASPKALPSSDRISRFLHQELLLKTATADWSRSLPAIQSMERCGQEACNSSQRAAAFTPWIKMGKALNEGTAQA